MSLNSQINELISNRPKYKIQPGYAENQNLAQQGLTLAKNTAFGRSRAIMAQEKNIDQNAADTMYAAGNESGSTSALLNTLAQVNNSRNTALRGLAADEATIQNANMAQVYGQQAGEMNANTAMSEEQDKEWNYNVNEPYMNKLNMLVQKKKFRQGLLMKGLDVLGSAATMGLSGAFKNIFSGAFKNISKPTAAAAENNPWGGDIG